MDGAMMEIGPYRVREGGNLEYNNGSWDEFANLLFVDQPVGTGFSYVNTDSYLTELDQMADHMMDFLQKWFDLFPEYEYDDVSVARATTLPGLTTVVIHCRRVICRPTHPLYCPCDPQPQQESKSKTLEPQGSADWKWLDVARGSISRISTLCL
jgi:hypothetical protein